MKKMIMTVSTVLTAALLLGSTLTGCKKDPEPTPPPPSTTATLTDAQVATWRAETDARITEIKNTPNKEIPEKTAVYYVSPNGNDKNSGRSPDQAWQTLERVNSTPLISNSYVCFERGGLWRGQLIPQNGITYTAYGEGEKPRIYRSEIDAADPALWEKIPGNRDIWMIQLDKNDVGTLVFNEGEAHAIKCIIRTEEDGTTYNNTTGERFYDYWSLYDDLHFYHDYKDTGKLYLYSEENPGSRFESINICSKGHAVNIPDGVNDVVIDNLCIKYTGSHGVGAGTITNLTVTNCEFAWIGGSIQSEGIYGRNYATRFGNAVQIWGGCENFTVTDNYIYQIYDAAITQQYTEREGRKMSQLNVNYSRNVIEYCNYSIEYWLDYPRDTDYECKGKIDNFLIADNYMWYAGEGFCEQRPDKSSAAHIKSWAGGHAADNFIIRNNLMFGSTYELIQINPDIAHEGCVNRLPHLEGNNVVGKTGQYFGEVFFGKSEGKQRYNEDILTYLGELSVSDVFWFKS